MRQQVWQLIAEYSEATRLGQNNRRPPLDLGLQRLQYLKQVLLRLFKKAEVVQWPAAAERHWLHLNSKAGPLQHFHGGFGDLWMEKIAECVGKQQTRLPAAVFHGAAMKPSQKRFVGEAWHLPLVSNSAEPLGNVTENGCL